MATLKMFLFGVPRLEIDGQPLSIHRRKMLALLAYLALSRQPHSREALANLFWPDNDTSTALANLRRDLSRLKDTLGTGVLQVDRDKVRIHPNADFWLDIEEFQDQIRLAEHDEDTPCSTCEEALVTAAVLYSGEFMAGFTLPDCPEFDDWQFYHSERLRQALIDVLRRLVTHKIDRRAFEDAIEYARRWQSLDPLHEPANRQLMQLYGWAGQFSAAIRQYQNLTQLLQDELGVEPEDETRELYEAIRARRLPPPGTPEKAPERPPQQDIPAQDRFILGVLESTGGFGEIYRGTDRVTGKTVAIKRLKSELVTNQPEIVERFLREVEALSQLNHPNIIHLLASYELDGQRCLVMEYLPGGTLRQLLEREGKLTFEKTLDIALELADALSRAHHLHILHRDIKPENILLDSDGHPKLIDFGLALLGSHTSRITQAGAIFGSPLYLSPEALRGEPLDARSDIWSFGIILYEMLTGRLPFASEQIAVALIKVINDPLPDVGLYRPEIPPRLADMLERMLTKDRTERIPSMRQVGAELEAIRAVHGTGQLNLTGSSSGYITPMEDYRAGGTIDTPSLPVQPTAFIGRIKELSEIQALLKKNEVRLISLIGPGGAGKSRLAIEAAARNQAIFKDSAAFVSLAPVASPEHIIAAIARSLHVRFTPGVEPKAQLLNRLQKKQMLLVVDNFEHLLAGTEILTEILEGAPGVKLLVTSRERLNLIEEWVYEVPGLDVPPQKEAGHALYESVELFIQRAQHVNPKFNPDPLQMNEIALICRLVEGLPLAIELAASWVRSMTVAEIAAEVKHNLDILTTPLRNIPERHRSMRAVVQQSWARLAKREQDVLANLSIFRGGCTREAAETVAGARAPLLAALVDKALLRYRNGRFDMHELIRQFAEEQLNEDSAHSQELTTVYLRYYLNWLQDFTPSIKGGKQREAVNAITTEIDNIREAWRGAVDQRDVEALEGAAECYWLYNEFRGLLSEGEAAFSTAADRFEALQDHQSLAGFLRAGQGSMAARQWRLEEGTRLIKKGIAVMQKADPPNPQREAFAKAWLAFMLVMQGRYTEGSQVASEATGYYEKTGDDWTQAGALRLLGAAALYQGDVRTAQTYLDQCLAICKAIGEQRIRTYALANLGLIQVWFGDYPLSRRYFDESIQISTAFNDRLSRADALCDYGKLFLVTGDYQRAAEVAQRCIAAYQDLGRDNVGMARVVLGWALRGQGKLDAATQAYLDGANAARSNDHQPDLAMALEGLGMVAYEKGDYGAAFRYFNESKDIWLKLNHEPQSAVLLSRLGWNAVMAGEPKKAEAYGYFKQAMQLARKHDLQPLSMDGLTGLGKLLGMDGKAADAARMLATVNNHPASTTETRQKAARLLEELTGIYPEIANQQAEPFPWLDTDAWEKVGLGMLAAAIT